MKIAFVTTGGTIDKDYPHTTAGWAFEIADPIVKPMLQFINPGFEYEIHSLFKKDSLEINEDDRQALWEHISNLKEEKIIITHGTDTLIETAQFIKSKNMTKTVVLTGAMKPGKFVNSDATFNIGSAVSAVALLHMGTYIVMHGVCGSPDEISRNMETGQFYISK